MSAYSRASAKLDLPEPLRPLTTVIPGNGVISNDALGPMPRKPDTVMLRRNAPAGSASVSVGSGRCWGDAPPPSCSARACSLSIAAITTYLASSLIAVSSSRSSHTVSASGFCPMVSIVCVIATPSACRMTLAHGADGRIELTWNQDISSSKWVGCAAWCQSEIV